MTKANLTVIKPDPNFQRFMRTVKALDPQAQAFVAEFAETYVKRCAACTEAERDALDARLNAAHQTRYFTREQRQEALLNAIGGAE